MKLKIGQKVTVMAGTISDEDLAREYTKAVNANRNNPGAMISDLMTVLITKYHLSLQEINALLPKFGLLQSMVKNLNKGQ